MRVTGGTSVTHGQQNLEEPGRPGSVDLGRLVLRRGLRVAARPHRVDRFGGGVGVPARGDGRVFEGFVRCGRHAGAYPAAVRFTQPDRGYGRGMSEMSDHRPPVDLPDVPEGEEISPADAVERADEDPDEQQNRVDPVWSETAADETDGDQSKS